MYVEKLTIENIRGIEKLSIDFTKQERPGWHVLIGDNGSGKSTILRALSLALIGPNDIKAFRLDFRDWLRKDSGEGYVSAIIAPSTDFDRYIKQSPPRRRPFEAKVILRHLPPDDSRYAISEVIVDKNGSVTADKYIWSNASGWFTAGFGPFRRFTGGEKDWESLHYSVPRAAALLSIFGEDVALTQSLKWLRELHHGQLDGFDDQKRQLKYFKRFINETGLLPQNTQLTDVNSKGVFFEDGNGTSIEITQMSDGFRTVLSMTFELMRQMIRTYGMDEVFKNWDSSQNLSVNLPGVVLIDEADVHLHPTWQQDIGEWFINRFPQVQFIVTTHSPLVCRAAHQGSIWRLATPGSGDDAIEPIIGQDKDRLVLGNLLDAYSTEAFGRDVTQSPAGQELAEKIARLSKKSFKGTITEPEEKALETMRAQLPTAS